jgi:Zn-dependent protease
MAVFGTSWRVGRIAGVEVRIDSSWVVIALLITYSMYLRLSVLYRELEGGGAVGLAFLSAVLFFGSVLVHELAHALVAQARGIRVQDITLFLFGGATRARVESRGPGDEFLIALVGPLTSGLLAGLFGIVAGLGGNVLSRPLAGTLGYLAWVNLLLAVFNLVPGFPLDGGRLLRSAIWKTTGSLARATRIASLAGQGVGWLLVAAGGGLAAGRGPGRRDLVRVHRLVPGPGRPLLLPGAPAAAAAARGRGRGGDGRRPATDPTRAVAAGGGGRLLHAL